MNNKTKIGIVGFLLVIVVATVWLLTGNPLDEKAPRETYVSENWETKYKLNEKDPYGLYLFNQLIRAHVDTSKVILPVTNSYALDSILLLKQKSTMLFVGDKFGLKTSEFDQILSKVMEGNDLVLSTNELTENIIRRLFLHYDVSYDYADSTNVYINNNGLPMYYLYQNDTLAHEWRAYLNIAPIDSTYRVMSKILDMPNFIRLKHGKGKIYLHTNPEFFFNYQLKRPEGYRYASFVLNQLPSDRPVYLLELGRLLEYNYDPYGEGDGTSDEQDTSYLQFILKSPALMAAFGFGLLGVLLFVLFRSKRMQPIVPYIEKKKNMSLEFAQTITSIYLSKSNPMGILKVQRQNFYDAMQKHFFVDISRKAKDRERSVRILSEKTTIPKRAIIELIELFEPKNQSELNENYLALVAQKQREIYVSTNIISDKMIEQLEGKDTVIQRNLFFSVGLILLGIFIVLLGFYYLVISIGVGIVFWPIGAIFLTIGIRRINRPMLLIKQDTITFYQTFGRKSSYARLNLMRISKAKNAFILYFQEDKTLKIKKIELSKFDKSQLERFIAKHHNLEL